MNKIVKFLCGLLLLSALVLPAVASVGAEPSSSHLDITLKTVPEQPVPGEETRIIVSLKSKGQQAVPNTVTVRAEMAMPAATSGMQHGSAGIAVTAKPGDQPSEYVATLKLTDLGDWKLTATSGDSAAQLKVTVVKPQPVNTNKSNTTAPSTAPATQNASTAVAPMEAVHASYLDLAANIADLRSRVDAWQKGDEDSLKIAEEKMDRIQVVLASVVWPGEMSVAIDKTRAAFDPMAKALKAKDKNAAGTAAKTIGDASHDVTHAFYPDYLPSLQEARFGPMAPHAIYLDLSANIADLRSRVSQWEKGDESSLNIAKEKVERIGVLLPHLKANGVLLKPVEAINKSLPAVAAALEKKDVSAAQNALKPLADGSHDLTHDFYSWLNVMSGAGNATCIQAAYLDLTLNIADLRTRLTQWEQGDEGSYNIAKEKLDRTGIVLAHTIWPKPMVSSVAKVETAVAPMAKALEAKDVKAAQVVAKDFSTASHDVVHAYYADWLPATQLTAEADQSGTTQTGNRTPVLSSAHGHSAAVPNYWFIGSIIGVVLITIVMVPILRQRDLKVQGVEVEA